MDGVDNYQDVLSIGVHPIHVDSTPWLSTMLPGAANVADVRVRDESAAIMTYLQSLQARSGDDR